MGELKKIDKVNTGENIRRLMRKARIDTFDLMMKLHLTSSSTIYSWTQGRVTPSAEALVKLSQIFDCSIDEILVLEGEEE